MLRNWRVWVLSFLLIGPVLAYISLGFLWLAEHEGPFGFRGELVAYATTAWIASGVVFTMLARRWTRSKETLLPPIDWDLPKTFTEHDRKAWDLVQDEAKLGDSLPMAAMTKFETYSETGQSLAGKLARHYRPHGTDPFEHIPIVDMLTAMQLASEDLVHLCREVPGGDMATPAHWKRAVQAAGYISRANEIYTFLLPLVQPAAGLVRLGAQKLMVQPAWRDMQENLMHWFFRAYVNRLGTHLVELYSGRLSIGAEQYRRLNRHRHGVFIGGEDQTGPMVIGVAGARGSGRTTLLAALGGARATHLPTVRNRLKQAGLDPALATQLEAAELLEISGYTTTQGGESARDRSTRRQAIRESSAVDMLLLVVDAAREDFVPEIRLVEQLEEWYATRPGRTAPPVLVVLTGVDRPDLPDAWSPPYDWLNGRRPREQWVRKRIDTLRGALPSVVADVFAVGLNPSSPFGVVEQLLPELATLLHHAERSAMLRHLDRVSSRSKVSRLAIQVGRQGRRLWEGVRPPR